MTRFLDGPAQGETLMLRRAPILLRVTRDPMGNFDGLDQLEHTPEANETLFAYRRQGKPSICHIQKGGKSGRREGGWYEYAEYKLEPEQPSDAVMRDNAAWQKWAQSRAASMEVK